MNLIDLIRSADDLTALRNRLGVVLEGMSMPLKNRKLNELTAQLLGVSDFNTAQGLAAKKSTETNIDLPVQAVLDVSAGGYTLHSMARLSLLIIDSDKHSVEAARQDDVPALLESIGGLEVAFWKEEGVGDERDSVVVDHYFSSLADQSESIAQIPAVDAYIVSDDQQLRVDFDALPYFLLRGHSIIPYLKAEGFSGGYASDEVAEYFRNRPGYEEITAFFNNIDIINDLKAALDQDRNMGYSVWINEEHVRQHVTDF